MATTDNGGPAFPEAIAIGAAGDVYPGFPGMTLRDWFAAQALAIAPEHHIVNADEKATTWARMAYALADAMLAERSK